MKAEILVGDVRSRLSEIPDGSVQCVVTSPPYWGLRDYGTASWEGGDPECDHMGKPMATKANINRNCGTGNDVKNATAREFFKETCGKCNATRVDSQIGLEQTPQEYVTEMVGVFREVWRVLADDGVLWLNLGDSYATGTAEGLKPKDLVGIPWRVAFALQDDGWYLRQDIIWAKPNPMPESVRDRCTKSHEYIFMLTKQPRYYFDNEAIKERGVMQAGDSAGSKQKDTRITHGLGGGNDGLNKAKQKLAAELAEKGYNTRNKRDVWTIPTRPFKGAHFAVMPEAIVEPCVLASSRPGDTVLDPFTGSGTVAVVALKHGRNYVGTELNPEYAEIAHNRITEACGGLINDIVLGFPQAGQTPGGVWKPSHTKSQNDSGQESTSAPPTTAGNGKDHSEATDTDSSTPKDDTGPSTGSPTTSPPTNHRPSYATNATTDGAATHTT